MTVSVLAAFIGMFLALHIFRTWDGQPLEVACTWMSFGSFHINMGFFFDHQAALLLFVVTFVGFWIHVFSVGYMDDDDARARFFGGLSIFMFSMLGIVLANNLFMIFVFWELVGFSSYMLIAHYINSEEASAACKKAFIVNRVGDFGFLVGIVWAYWHFGTVNLVEMQSLVTTNPALIKAAIAFLLMCGFLGKSAQFPLHVWLPDAMAGPTPISALIHAATMVAAGIYFLCRVDFLFPEEVKTVILWLGAVMTAYAGFCALGQRDIKKILAYSTLSQLGYMAVAYGLGFPGLALFHLTCHAFFKALLFLGSGSVIHACHHEQDIFNMGGLIRRMPITSLTFAVGTMALSAVTFTSGYFSKDAIIEAAFLKDKAVYWVVYGAAFLTSIYMGRLFWIAFLGAPKTDKAAHAHESGPFMVAPLLMLAFLALVGGFVQYWPENLGEVFFAQYHAVHEQIAALGVEHNMLLAGVVAWAAGFLLTYFFYKPGAEVDRLEEGARPLYLLFKHKLWFDELYNAYVAKIQDRFASLLSFLDLALISGFIIRGSAGLVGLVGIFFRTLHVGSLHGYVYWFLAGLVLFCAFAFGML